jgi:hypothetical protein
MNSSTSSSEAAASVGWRRWLALYLLSFAGIVTAIYLLVVICDPFSTGRFTPFRSIDIAFSGLIESHAGRVRDPAFDSAVIGNSIAGRIQPQSLNGAADRRFVLLAVAGLGPKNELTIARAFMRHHAGTVKTIVFMLEQYWCTTDEQQMLRYPDFPDWLYDKDDISYLQGILSIDSLQATIHRLAIHIAHAPAAGRRDGLAESPEPAVWQLQNIRERRTSAPPKPWTFVALEQLQAFRNSIDDSVQMIMLFVPFHVSELPLPGSDADAWLNSCKMRAKAIAETNPRTLLIDHMREDDLARDTSNFTDARHVRDHVTRMIEAEIAASIRTMSSTTSGHSGAQ